MFNCDLQEKHFIAQNRSNRSDFLNEKNLFLFDIKRHVLAKIVYWYADDSDKATTPQILGLVRNNELVASYDCSFMYLS